MPGSHKWQHRFQGHVSRWTGPREAILRLLSQTSKHMSAKEIYSSLYQKHPSLGLTTVYRTLDLLTRMDLINKITLGNGQRRFEFKKGKKTDHHHHHLICTGCDKIFDYKEFEKEELAFVKKTEKNLSRKFNFKIMDHNIEFYGLCDKCNLNIWTNKPKEIK